MARLDETYSIDTLPQGERGSFEPLPDGWYDVVIHSAENKTTKAGNGSYLHLRYDVEGPSHQGRAVFGNLNLRNANPKAEQIGRQQFGELMRAIGLATVSDTDQLVGGRLSIKLTTRQDEKYGASNEVKGFRARAGAVPPKPAAAAPRSTPPWAKK